MYTYYVIDKSNLALVFKYDAEAPIEWGAYPFAQYDHQQNPWENGPTPAPLPTPVVHTPLTKLQFLRRFTQDERIAIREAAKLNAVMEDYLRMLDLAEDVFLDDPDTINAVTMMEQVGLIGFNRASEILSGN